MFLVEFLNIASLLQQLLENEVFNQIGCRQLRSTRVERLEYLLSILFSIEINHDHLKELSSCGFNRNCTRLNEIRTFAGQPFRGSFGKELVGLHHSLVLVLERRVIGWYVGRHDFIKSRTVAICRPYFEAVFGFAAERCSVHDQGFHP